MRLDAGHPSDGERRDLISIILEGMQACTAFVMIIVDGGTEVRSLCFIAMIPLPCLFVYILQQSLSILAMLVRCRLDRDKAVDKVSCQSTRPKRSWQYKR